MSQNIPLCVYVVEDEDDTRQILSSVLGKRGHDVHGFASADIALESFAEHMPSLILLDWSLPRMTGLEFCGKVREMSDIVQPVILMATANADNDALAKALDVGVDDYISKPFSLALLTVRIQIAEKRARARLGYRQLEERMDEGRNYVADLTSSIPAGIMVVDEKEHIILECNDYAADMIGHSIDDISGRECHQFVCPREKGACPISDLNEDVDRCKTVLLTDSGEKAILKTARKTTYNGREVILELFVDIEDLEKAQEQLRRYANEMESLAMERAEQLVHADRLALLGTMLAGVSHEIGNCLNMLGPNIQMAEKYWDCVIDVIAEAAAEDGASRKLKIVSEEMGHTLKALRDGASRTNELLVGLKGYSKKLDDRTAPFNLKDCIDSSLVLCHNSLKYGVDVLVNVDDDIIVNGWSKQHLDQILMNLIANASNAMKGKGKLAITARKDDVRILLDVEDSGPGIPPENREEIWKPFFTTHAKDTGTGLGLYIVKGIVEQYKGQIIVDRSEDLGGARFNITFPQ